MVYYNYAALLPDCFQDYDIRREEKKGPGAGIEFCSSVFNLCNYLYAGIYKTQCDDMHVTHYAFASPEIPQYICQGVIGF